MHGPKRCWVAGNCLGGEVGGMSRVNDTIAYLIGSLLLKNKIFAIFDSFARHLSQFGQQLSSNFKLAYL